MAELKPCPFCGDEPECDRTLNMPPDDWQWFVRCCCFVAPASWDESRDKAVSEWNRRAPNAGVAVVQDQTFRASDGDGAAR